MGCSQCHRVLNNLKILKDIRAAREARKMIYDTRAADLWFQKPDHNFTHETASQGFQNSKCLAWCDAHRAVTVFPQNVPVISISKKGSTTSITENEVQATRSSQPRLHRASRWAALPYPIPRNRDTDDSLYSTRISKRRWRTAFWTSSFQSQRLDQSQRKLWTLEVCYMTIWFMCLTDGAMETDFFWDLQICYPALYPII